MPVNLANAAFFATKKLEERIKKLELELEEVKKQIRDTRSTTIVEIKDPI